jgi:hypothetical protein
MKTFDSYHSNDTPPLFSSELTRVVPLWNHHKTVAADLMKERDAWKSLA